MITWLKSLICHVLNVLIQYDSKRLKTFNTTKRDPGFVLSSSGVYWTTSNTPRSKRPGTMSAEMMPDVDTLSRDKLFLNDWIVSGCVRGSQISNVDTLVDTVVDPSVDSIVGSRADPWELRRETWSYEHDYVE